MNRYRGVLTQLSTQVTVSLLPGQVTQLMVAQPSVTGATTVTAASNNIDPTSGSVIHVATTAGFATSGSVNIAAHQHGVATPIAVTYSGVLGGGDPQFTGCTTSYIAADGFVLATGDAVSGSKTVTFGGVGQWVNDPTQATASNAVDLYQFWHTGTTTVGAHINTAGPLGATGPAGLVGVTFRGGFLTTASSYAVNDVVTYNGSTYICKLAVASPAAHLPTDATYWDLMADANGSGPPIFIQPQTGDVTQSFDAIGARSSNVVTWVAGGVLDSTPNTKFTTVKAQGVTGFWYGIPGAWIYKNQGTAAGDPIQTWTGDPAVPLSPTGPTKIQYGIRNGSAAKRLKSLGQECYLGFQFQYGRTASAPWFGISWWDDATWGVAGTPTSPVSGATAPATTALGVLKSFAGMAKLEGFTGMAWDFETNSAGTLSVALEGHSEAVTRAQVQYRGRQMMEAIAAGWNAAGGNNDSKHMFYLLELGKGNDDYVYGATGSGTSTVPHDQNIDHIDIDWLKGMTSQNNWGQISDGNSHFYYGSFSFGGQFETQLMFEINGKLASFSQLFPNWNYAAQRIGVGCGALWPGPSYYSPGTFLANQPAPPSKWTPLFQAFNKWAMQGHYWVFAGIASEPLTTTYMTSFTITNGAISSTNPYGYTGTPFGPVNYVPSWQAGALNDGSKADVTAPTATVSSVTRSGANVIVTGTALHQPPGNSCAGVRRIAWVNGAQSGHCSHQFVTANKPWDVLGTVNATWPFTATIPAANGDTVKFYVESIKGVMGGPFSRVITV